MYVCSSSPFPPLFLARLRVVGTDGGGAAAAGGGGGRGGEQVHSHGSNYDWRGQRKGAIGQNRALIVVWCPHLKRERTAERSDSFFS